MKHNNPVQYNSNKIKENSVWFNKISSIDHNMDILFDMTI